MYVDCKTSLRLYDTMTTFHAAEKRTFENIVGKGRNASHQDFLLSTVFPT